MIFCFVVPLGVHWATGVALAQAQSDQGHLRSSSSAAMEHLFLDSSVPLWCIPLSGSLLAFTGEHRLSQMATLAACCLRALFDILVVPSALPISPP